jgi:predicted ATPase/class 3 adenylate cyclase
VLVDHAPRPGSGILTFLFTDIEGSTRRWEADADAMRLALDTHNETLRSAVTTHDGTVFNYTGDGMCAVFASPRSAIDTAVDAQRTLELPVRMGIGTGEAELRDGEYFGTVLNRTARVMAAGHGGQILIDGTTAGLLSGVDLISLGQRRLRDIAKLVDVYQVQAEGLRTEFPPLKTADPAPGNLRRPTTTFVGRESEVVELSDLLKAHRLVTLTGVGGVGKTRLALEVGARLADTFREGVWVIELAAVGNPAAVPDAVAAVLGITQQPALSVADSVAAALEGRLRLLIFDNCEHVLDAAAEIVEAILTRSDTVRIIATSREGLRVEDEQLWTVPSLDTTGGLDSSAASLFVDRAQAIARGISLTPHNAVLEICQRLDCIPLAIELAASRLLSMSVTEVRDHLDNRFRLLVGSRRGLERHQTLRHAVEWSYDLLEDAEKQLLARCSVFAGGFDLPAVCVVAGSDDEFATLDLLDSLVRKSLLVPNRTSERTRFSMLETIREFAQEQLVAFGDADETRNTHARYFADRESDIFRLWDGPRQREAYLWVAAELANLRAAFRWATDHDDLDTAAAIVNCAAFVGFWGAQHEPIRWAEELIEPARAVQHRRLAQLYTAAAVCYTAGRIEDAVGYAAAGQAAVMTGGFDEVHAEMEASLGGSSLVTGEPERWVEWCRTVLARRPATYVHAQACLAIALKYSGPEEEALAAADDLIAAADATESPNLAAYAHFAYGFVYRDADPARAHEILRRGLAIAQDSGSRMTESSIAGVLSLLATYHGEPNDAIEHLILSIRYYHDSGSVYLLPTALAVLAVLFDRLGHYEAAATTSGFANTYVAATIPGLNDTKAHLREVLSDERYESFASEGEQKTTAEMIAYAFEQIDRARAQLSPVGGEP